MQHFTAVRQVLEGGAGAVWQSVCSTETSKHTLASSTKQVVKLALVAGKKGADLLLFGQDFLILDA